MRPLCHMVKVNRDSRRCQLDDDLVTNCAVLSIVKSRHRTTKTVIEKRDTHFHSLPSHLIFSQTCNKIPFLTPMSRESALSWLSWIPSWFATDPHSPGGFGSGLDLAEFGVTVSEQTNRGDAPCVIWQISKKLFIRIFGRAGELQGCIFGPR